MSAQTKKESKLYIFFEVILYTGYVENQSSKASKKLIITIVKYFRKNGRKIGINGSFQNIRIFPLERGESNIGYILELEDQQRFVIRIAQLYPDGIKREYDLLKQIPDDCGPKPIYLDTSKTLIPFPYMIESFIAGKKIARWGFNSLHSLAHTLSRIHAVKKKIKEHREKINIISFFEKENELFLSNQPSIQTNQEIQAILKRVNKFFMQKQFLFDEIKTLSLVHGDLNSSNILADEKNTIRLIDWELAFFGDYARDFAAFYYDDMRYLDWRIQLDTSDRKYFINTYRSVSGINDPLLEHRIAVWQIWDKCGAYLYAKWKLSQGILDSNTQMEFIKASEQLYESINFTISRA